MEKQSDFASQYYAILIIVHDVLIQEWILKIQQIKKKYNSNNPNCIPCIPEISKFKLRKQR